MSTDKFADLCEGAAISLNALAKQARGDLASAELLFEKTVVNETVKPLLDIVTVIITFAK